MSVPKYDASEMDELILPKTSAHLILETWPNPTNVYRGFLGYLLVIHYPSSGKEQLDVVGLWMNRRGPQ